MKQGDYVVLDGIPCVVVYTTSSMVYLSAEGTNYATGFSKLFLMTVSCRRFRMATEQPAEAAF